SRFCSSCFFSSTASSRRRWMDLDRCISLAALWPTKPRSAALAPVLSTPNLLFSVRSDQPEARRADSVSRPMSFCSFSCRASSKA
ncbi:MrpA C-terminal/MbhD domain-containing protein, partial [Dysosmobacter welbionis]